MTEHGKAARAEYTRKYREEHRDKIAENRRKYYEAHKEQVKEAARRYYEANKDAIKSRNAVYWDRKAAQSIEEETPEQKAMPGAERMLEPQEKLKHEADGYETPEMPNKAIRTEIKRYELKKSIQKLQNKKS